MSLQLTSTKLTIYLAWLQVVSDRTCPVGRQLYYAGLCDVCSKNIHLFPDAFQLSFNCMHEFQCTF